MREEEVDSKISKRQRFADRRLLADLFNGVKGERHIRSERIDEAVIEYRNMLTALQKYLGLHPSTLSCVVKRIGKEQAARLTLFNLISTVLSPPR